MNEYSAILNVSSAMLKLLREMLVPEVISSREGIALCSPFDHGDAVVSIYMYDMKDEGIRQTVRNIPKGEGIVKNPSVFLKLSYMISVFSKAESSERSMEEMKILGSIIQVLNDYVYISSDTYEFIEDGRNNAIMIEPARLLDDAKHKIFSLPNMIHKPSVFYTASPVEIKSGREKRFVRVKEFLVQNTNNECGYDDE